MPLPPPLHGSNLMNQYVADSPELREVFDVQLLSIRYVSSIADIGRISGKKALIFLSLVSRLAVTLVWFRPDFVYFVPAVTGLSFYRDYLLSLVIKSSGCRVIYHIHGKGIGERAINPIVGYLYRSFFNNGFVILLSRLLFDEFRRFVREDSVRYLANGIEMIQKARMPDACGYDEATRILFLSNLMLSKGPIVLLDAAVILRDMGLPFMLDIVGNPSIEMSLGEFQGLIEAKGLESCVFLLGPKYGQEKLDVLARSDMLVFPTSNDCFPLVILEAMSQGLPVISTFQGAIPEIVEDGVTGLLIKAADPVMLAEKMAYLIGNPKVRLDMGAMGRKKFEEMYDLRVFNRNLVDVLAQITGASWMSGGAPIELRERVNRFGR
jgi:glycosyltransferase involved in cell wall biosynthesis